MKKQIDPRLILLFLFDTLLKKKKTSMFSLKHAWIGILLSYWAFGPLFMGELFTFREGREPQELGCLGWIFWPFLGSILGFWGFCRFVILKMAPWPNCRFFSRKHPFYHITGRTTPRGELGQESVGSKGSCGCT